MKKMKTIKRNKRKLPFKIALLMLLLPLFGMAQQLTPMLTGAAGGTFSNGSGSIEFSAGEPVVGLFTGNSIMLYQGFQQGILNSIGIAEKIPANKQIIIYPNPASATLFVKSKFHTSGGMYILKNLQGQTVATGSFSQLSAGINLDNLQAGTYLITFNINGHQPVNKIFIKQ